MDKNKELTDEELEQVSGGGNGGAPEGGVMAVPYDSVRPGYYYVKNQNNLNFIIYVYDECVIDGKQLYIHSVENFFIRPDGSWYTEVIAAKCYSSYADITSIYKFRLNVVPY